MNNSALWDRLAGEVSVYIDNYIVAKNGGGKFHLKPSYPVDYKIEDIDKIISARSIDEYYVHVISGCKNINELPEPIKKLVIQYLPRFFAKWPEYASEKCLRIKEKRNESDI